MWAMTFLLLHGPVAAQVALVCRIMMMCLASRLSLHWLTVPYVHSTKHIWFHHLQWWLTLACRWCVAIDTLGVAE